MTNKEFTDLTSGMTSDLLSRLLGRGVSQINSYRCGRSPIPFEVAKIVLRLDEFYSSLVSERKKLNSSVFRKTVNGVKYDTSQAVFIAEWSNGLSHRDFRFCVERLYKTARGRFFLHGEGGAMSRWSVSCGQNSQCGGESILPLDASDARDWLLCHEFTSEFEALFEKLPQA